MSPMCRNMDDLERHRFHGLEHDSKDAAFHNLLSHIYFARLRSLRENAKAEKHKQRTKNG